MPFCGPPASCIRSISMTKRHAHQLMRLCYSSKTTFLTSLISAAQHDILQVARERDPDSKRFRFKPGNVKPLSGRWGSCCVGVNVRWLAVGFVLGMLIFATLSVLQVTCRRPPASTQIVHSADGSDPDVVHSSRSSCIASCKNDVS
jgi:hypothetical protein